MGTPITLHNALQRCLPECWWQFWQEMVDYCLLQSLQHIRPHLSNCLGIDVNTTLSSIWANPSLWGIWPFFWLELAAAQSSLGMGYSALAKITMVFQFYYHFCFHFLHSHFLSPSQGDLAGHMPGDSQSNNNNNHHFTYISLKNMKIFSSTFTYHFCWYSMCCLYDSYFYTQLPSSCIYS
jgi:hypothetical protein